MQAVPNSLAVPIVLWGNKCPTHCISSIIVSPSRDCVVTGSHDGQICLWQLKNGTFKGTPTKLFVGHSKAVTCLTWVSSAATSFVSSSESGEMCLWDLEDSSCKEATLIPYVHSSIQYYHLVGRRSSQLFCNGYYPDILVYDANSLVLLFRLISRINSDWITSVIIMKPAGAPDDVVIGLTISGSMKVWTISPDFKGTGKETIYENESKQIRVQNAWTLKSCPTFPRTMLIVSPKTWHIYDVRDFSLLCTTAVPAGAHWATGDFLTAEQMVIYATDGTAYLYRLPGNAIVDDPLFRKKFVQTEKDLPASLYGVLKIPNSTPQACEPSWTIFRAPLSRGEYPFNVGNYVLRGDARGRISVWAIPEYSKEELNSLIAIGQVIEHAPIEITLMDAEWDRLTKRQPGVIDRSDFEDGGALKIISSLYVPMHGRMFLGMEDGAIIMLPALQKLSSQLFIGKKSDTNMPVYRFLRGHEGKVTALLYPHQDDPRYDPGMLISGGIDFTIRVWDLYQCQLQHTFVCQAGEILQLITPPSGCNSRVLHSICSIASDHSIALLSLKERKAIMMASRHVFPISAIKWRPVDDFLLVQCTDGTVYVWQMETGHLDRVVQGSAADDVMRACDEEVGDSNQGYCDEVGSNSTLQLFRAIKNRNIDAARQAAKQGLNKLANAGNTLATGSDGWSKTFIGYPLTIQSVRSNPLDQESHLLLFDVEALVLQLLSEENRTDLTDSGKPAPRMEGKTGDWKSGAAIPGAAAAVNSELLKPQKHAAFAPEGMSMAMEVAQVLVSLLYAWGLDAEMDKLCSEKLGMLQPKQAVTYGIVSKVGYMTLLLPIAGLHRRSIDLPQPQERIRDTLATITRNHWAISSTLTTMHLLTLISVANTLMNIQNATFHQDYEKRRKLHRRLVRMDSKAVASSGLSEFTQGLGGYSTSEAAHTFAEQQNQVKQTWSQLTTLHCILLSERLGQENYKSPDVEMLIRRWQDRCMEIRTASQALILSELRRIGGVGRRRLMEQWAVFLPNFTENEKAPLFEVRPAQMATAVPPDTPASDRISNEDSEFEELQQDSCMTVNPNLPSVYSVEYRRKQSTAIILLGIIGAEFGPESQTSPVRSASSDTFKAQQETLSVLDPAIRLVAKALSYIVINPEDKLQPYSSLRRSAVDLLGRGFTVWEPFLDVGQVLLSLLRFTLDVDRPLASQPVGIPLNPVGDMARASRHALEMIASVRPRVIITVINMEITRHNSLIQSAQTLNINLNNAIIVRAKEEVLRVLDLLISKHPQNAADLIIEVVDIVVHCLDSGRVKTNGLLELFPPLGKFPMVAYCKQNRRIATGSKKGGVFIYELRGMKNQSYGGHTQPVSACEFAPDGKHLATFSVKEGKIQFWHIGAPLFGLGNAQPRTIKTLKTPSVSWEKWPDLKDQPEYRLARLRWISNKDVLVMLINGKEEKFTF